MGDKKEDKCKVFDQCPSIVSEMKIDFNEVFKMNQSIVDMVLESDLDVASKGGILSRILPNLARANACACSCSCSCSCSGDSFQGGSTPQAGRVCG